MVSPSDSHHLEIDKSGRSVVIHGPASNRQHRPQAGNPSGGFWAGPFSSYSDTSRIANELARLYRYSVYDCRVCFRLR